LDSTAARRRRRPGLLANGLALAVDAVKFAIPNPSKYMVCSWSRTGGYRQ